LGVEEGQIWLGFQNVSTNTSGTGSWNFTLPTTVPVGSKITATATDSNGNTSEFSQAVTVNYAPTISDIANRLIDENTSTGPIGFTVGDSETSAGSLIVTASSSNTTLVPAASIVLGGSGAIRTLSLTPVANQFGTATITVTVSDGKTSVSDTMVLTVNDIPVISDIANLSTNQDTATGPIAFTVSDSETSASSLTVTGSSSNTSLVPNANIVFGGSGANRTVTVTPAAGKSGSATITVVVSDGTASPSDTFVLTVNAVNTPPAVTLTNLVTTLPENTSTALATRVADIVISDDGLGDNVIGIAGADAAFFEISNSKLFLKAGTVLNGIAKPSYSLQVTVDDATIGNGIDSSVSFTLNIAAVRSQILAPPPQTQSQRPVLTWTAVPGAANYEVWINNVSTGGWEAAYHSFVNATSDSPNFDLGIGRFRLWVRSIDGSGAPSAWTPQYDFTINTLAILQPIDRYQPTLRPVVSWSPLPGAVKYDIWINDVSRGISPYIRSTNVAGTSFTPVADMPLGVYRAWVRGIAADGTSAAWSQGVEYLTLQAPTIISPVNSTFSRRPVFTWNALPGAVTYELQIRNLSTFVTVHNAKGIAATNWTPPANLPDGPYRWWVIGIGPNNLRSFWTAGVDINIGGVTSLITPAGTINNSFPVFTWKPVDGAARYELWVTNVSLGVVSINRTDLTATSFIPASSLPVGTYRAWVRAVSSSGEFALWSPQANFVIASTGSGDDDWIGDSSLALAHSQAAIMLRTSLNVYRLSQDSKRVIPVEDVSQRKAGRHASGYESQINISSDVRDIRLPVPGNDDASVLFATEPLRPLGALHLEQLQDTWYDVVMEEFIRADFTM